MNSHNGFIKIPPRDDFWECWHRNPETSEVSFQSKHLVSITSDLFRYQGIGVNISFNPNLIKPRLRVTTSQKTENCIELTLLAPSTFL